MSISFEKLNILGILLYLDYPKYLNNITILNVKDIFDKIEEKIEELAVEVDELENNYRLVKEENDKVLIINKINNTKNVIINIKNQLKFIKN